MGFYVGKGRPPGFRKEVGTIDELTREVDVRQKPLYLKWLEELFDGDLLLNSFLYEYYCVNIDHIGPLMEIIRMHVP